MVSNICDLIYLLTEYIYHLIVDKIISIRIMQALTDKVVFEPIHVQFKHVGSKLHLFWL